jgi:hypothetical protein
MWMNWYSTYKEAEAKNRTIFYHGTKASLLPKILSEGLIPNPKERAWGEDPASRSTSVSRVSYDGIYVTSSLMTAISSAGTAANKNGKRGNPRIIVVMELQPKTLFADEDDIVHRIEWLEGSSLHNPISDTIGNYLIVKHPQLTPFAQRFKNRCLERFVSEARSALFFSKDGPPNPKLSEELEKLLPLLYEVMLERRIGYADQKDWDREIENFQYQLRGRGIHDVPSPQKPFRSDGEAHYREMIDRLTRLLKYFARPESVKGKSQTTARSVERIGFIGSNRIISIVRIDYDEEGKSHPSLAYGEWNEKFMNDWRTAVDPREEFS